MEVVVTSTAKNTDASWSLDKSYAYASKGTTNSQCDPYYDSVKGDPCLPRNDTGYLKPVRCKPVYIPCLAYEEDACADDGSRQSDHLGFGGQGRGETSTEGGDGSKDIMYTDNGVYRVVDTDRLSANRERYGQIPPSLQHRQSFPGPPCNYPGLSRHGYWPFAHSGRGNIYKPYPAPIGYNNQYYNNYGYKTTGINQELPEQKDFQIGSGSHTTTDGSSENMKGVSSGYRASGEVSDFSESTPEDYEYPTTLGKMEGKSDYGYSLSKSTTKNPFQTSKSTFGKEDRRGLIPGIGYGYHPDFTGDVDKTFKHSASGADVDNKYCGPTPTYGAKHSFTHSNDHLSTDSPHDRDSLKPNGDNGYGYGYGTNLGKPTPEWNKAQDRHSYSKQYGYGYERNRPQLTSDAPYLTKPQGYGYESSSTMSTGYPSSNDDVSGTESSQKPSLDTSTTTQINGSTNISESDDLSSDGSGTSPENSYQTSSSTATNLGPQGNGFQPYPSASSGSYGQGYIAGGPKPGNSYQSSSSIAANLGPQGNGFQSYPSASSVSYGQGYIAGGPKPGNSYQSSSSTATNLGPQGNGFQPYPSASSGSYGQGYIAGGPKPGNSYQSSSSTTIAKPQPQGNDYKPGYTTSSGSLNDGYPLGGTISGNYYQSSSSSPTTTAKVQSHDNGYQVSSSTSSESYDSRYPLNGASLGQSSSPLTTNESQDNDDNTVSTTTSGSFGGGASPGNNEQSSSFNTTTNSQPQDNSYQPSSSTSSTNDGGYPLSGESSGQSSSPLTTNNSQDNGNKPISTTSSGSFVGGASPGNYGQSSASSTTTTTNVRPQDNSYQVSSSTSSESIDHHPSSGAISGQSSSSITTNPGPQGNGFQLYPPTSFGSYGQGYIHGGAKQGNSYQSSSTTTIAHPQPQGNDYKSGYTTSSGSFNGGYALGGSGSGNYHQSSSSSSNISANVQPQSNSYQQGSSAAYKGSGGSYPLYGSGSGRPSYQSSAPLTTNPVAQDGGNQPESPTSSGSSDSSYTPDLSTTGDSNQETLSSSTTSSLESQDNLTVSTTSSNVVNITGQPSGTNNLLPNSPDTSTMTSGNINYINTPYSIPSGNNRWATSSTSPAYRLGSEYGFHPPKRIPNPNELSTGYYRKGEVVTFKDTSDRVIPLGNGCSLKRSQLNEIIDSFQTPHECVLTVPQLFSGPLDEYAHVMNSFPSSVDTAEGFVYLPSGLLVPYDCYRRIAAIYAPQCQLFKEVAGMVLSNGQYVDSAAVGAILSSARIPDARFIVTRNNFVIPFEIYKNYINKISPEDKQLLKVLVPNLCKPVPYTTFKEVLEKYVNGLNNNISDKIKVIKLLESKTEMSLEKFLCILNNYPSFQHATVTLPSKRTIPFGSFLKMCDILGEDYTKNCLVNIPNTSHSVPYLVLKEICKTYTGPKAFDLSRDTDVNTFWNVGQKYPDDVEVFGKCIRIPEYNSKYSLSGGDSSMYSEDGSGPSDSSSSFNAYDESIPTKKVLSLVYPGKTELVYTCPHIDKHPSQYHQDTDSTRY